MKILVGVSAAEHATAVIEFASRMARESASQLILLHVKPNPWKHCKGYLEDVERDQIDRDLACLPDTTEQFMGDSRRSLEEAGVDVKCIVLESDDPAACILLVAEEENVDLLVIGATERYFFVERILRPSIATRIIKGSRRPVLVIPS